MMNVLNKISFKALIGHDLKGTGLLLDPAENNVCVNRFEGMDISDFDVGVLVQEAAPTAVPGSGKCDGHHYSLAFVRRCNTCIWEKHNGIDSAVWDVNVDAASPNSVAIRIAGIYDKWYITTGLWTHYADEKPCKSIILDPGARENTLESVLPRRFWWPYSEDNSGNNTNVVISPP